MRRSGYRNHACTSIRVLRLGVGDCPNDEFQRNSNVLIGLTLSAAGFQFVSVVVQFLFALTNHASAVKAALASLVPNFLSVGLHVGAAIGPVGGVCQTRRVGEQRVHSRRRLAAGRKRLPEVYFEKDMNLPSASNPLRSCPSCSCSCVCVSRSSRMRSSAHTGPRKLHVPPPCCRRRLLQSAVSGLRTPLR